MQYGPTDILTLLGALGLFLYGMKVMSDSLMEVAGDRMRNILASMTSNRFFAVLTGFFITAIIQSSSATTLMVLSFVNASLLTLFESVGVIMGANIGTTVTAWLITLLGFKVSMAAIALPLVGLGFLMTFSKKVKTKGWGEFLIGFAVLFIGLEFLKDAVPDLNENPEMLAWLSNYTELGMLSILLFLLLGTVLTVIIQSSSATLALTLVMCYEGWVPFDLAAAMVMGGNIGTTITANLAAIVANDNAKRSARAHFLFNILGVVWLFFLLKPYLSGIDWFMTRNGGPSPYSAPEVIPVALSVFHTSFNIINTIVLIWFIPSIVTIVERMIPHKAEEALDVHEPEFLTENALNYPQTAMSALINESKRLFEGPVFEIMTHSVNVHREDVLSGLKAKNVIKASQDIIEIDINEIYYRKVKNIYGKTLEYSTRMLSIFNLPVKSVERVNKIRLANRYIVQAIKDVRELQPSVDLYMNSDNVHIKKRYNSLRRKLTKVLQVIYSRNGSVADPTMRLIDLEKLLADVRKHDMLLDGTLDDLVGGQKISLAMASTLANDSNYLNDICTYLIKAAELLYIESDTVMEELRAEQHEEVA